ncbi:hypothetical protein EDB19DRAFT_1824738 [Suillus lakei]|nr:hypothetical protein EDB19DRAFT_1824738 [Suillus lakei]
MQMNIEGTTASSGGNILLLDSGLIGALQKTTPDLETPYSIFPNIDYSAINAKNLGIVAIVTERQQQLDAVLNEISGLEGIMDSVKNLHQQLVGKKENFFQSMNLHKGLVSALWRFPTEVLSQIFHYCLPEYHRWCRGYSSDRDVPMQLAAICRRWRDVVVDMPSLWCRLHRRNPGDWEQVASYYDSWLKRAREFPLSLSSTLVL